MPDSPTAPQDAVPRKLRRAGDEIAPGVWWVEHEAVGASRARALLLDDDYQVLQVPGQGLDGLRQAQAALVAALSLPASATANLDALVDALRDLDLWWPRTLKIALLWSDADVLRAHDREGFDELVAILGRAHEHLRPREDDPDPDSARLLLTVLVPAVAAPPLDPTDPSIQ